MRLLWVTSDLPPRAGGIEQFVANLLVRIDPEGSLVVGPHHPDAPSFDDRQPFTVVRAPGRLLPTPATLSLVRSHAADHAPDVIVLGSLFPLGQLAPALARDPGVPLVALTHGLEAGIAAVGLGALIRRSTRACAAATTVSDFATRRLAPHMRAGRVRRVSPGVDVGMFHPDVDGTALREKWGIPRGAPLVGCISRFVRRKGQDVLLEAWPAVREHHPDAWLVLVGSGPLEPTVQAAVEDLGPGGQAVVAGEVAWEDLPAAHAALDLFAMPCRTRWAGLDVEGLGIVYLEAQACGVPVVAGRSGGAPETVIENRTGLVVDGADAGAVAAAVTALLDDPDDLRTMGGEGRAWVERRWSWDVVAAGFRAVVDEVLTFR